MTQVRKQFPKVQKLFILLSYKSKLALLNLEQDEEWYLIKFYVIIEKSLSCGNLWGFPQIYVVFYFKKFLIILPVDYQITGRKI